MRKAMEHKVWIHSLSFNISRVSRRIFAVSLAVLLLLFASSPRGEVTAAIQQQKDEKAGAAQKLFDEGAQLYQQQTAEALRIAIQKLEKALSLCRELDDQKGQAWVLLFLGLINSDLG